MTRDLLELSDAEGELARVQGEIRDLKNEILHLDEKRDMGQAVDEAALSELRRKVSELSQRQRFLMTEVFGDEPETEEKGLGSHLVDFVIDHKIGVFLGLMCALMLGGYYFIHDRSEDAGERMAQAQVRQVQEIFGD